MDPKQKSICVFVSLVTSELGFSYVPFPWSAFLPWLLFLLLCLANVKTQVRQLSQGDSGGTVVSGALGIVFSLIFFLRQCFYIPATSDSIAKDGLELAILLPLSPEF